jgi:hypothetical protein
MAKVSVCKTGHEGLLANWRVRLYRDLAKELNASGWLELRCMSHWMESPISIKKMGQIGIRIAMDSAGSQTRPPGR